MNTDYLDAHGQTIPYGEAALRNICEHGTSAEPAAYSVWYAFVRNSNAALVAEVQGKLKGDGGISDQELGALHLKYFGNLTASLGLDDIAEALGVEMAGTISSLRESVGELSGRGAQLQAVLERLARLEAVGPDVREALAAIVATSGLIAGTNKRLRARLAESQKNVSGLKADLEAVRTETVTDSLTGLFNRRALDQRLSRDLRSGETSSDRLVLAIVDIDHFKRFNDQHGHPVGDQVIRLVASCLKDGIAPPGFVARYGGEEFAIVMPDIDLATAAAALERVRQRIGQYDIVQRGTQRRLGRVTVSVGLAPRETNDTPAELLERADRCLYAAKRSGRDRLATKA